MQINCIKSILHYTQKDVQILIVFHLFMKTAFITIILGLVSAEIVVMGD